MKIQRLAAMVMAVCLCVALSACGGDSAGSDTKAVDVDLTKLSSTVVYAEVYNMMSAPEEYIGKTVKMNGSFAIYQATDGNGNVVSDAIYYACIIEDATACCVQGIEFVLEKAPDKYPELGTNITVTGEFQTYEENGQMYIHLVDAVLT